MARPKAATLTERELEVMQVFWDHGELAAMDARDELERQGRDLSYTTVATLTRILLEKGFLKQVTHQRPFRFQPIRSHAEVSKNLLGELLKRVFGGSREQLLLRLMEGDKLTARERDVLEQILQRKRP